MRRKLRECVMHYRELSAERILFLLDNHRPINTVYALVCISANILLTMQTESF